MLEILQFKVCNFTQMGLFVPLVTMANHSNYALQNPFTCVLNIMSNTPVSQYYMNPPNHSNASFLGFY